MKRSKRLSIVVEMAKRDEERVAQGLQLALEQLSNEETRLRELEEYYRDYEQRFAAQTQGLRAEQIVSNRNFLQQLAETIQVQEQQLARARLQAEEIKREWHKRYLKHENLVGFVDQIRNNELAIEDKIEQKQVDEWVTQSHPKRQ